MTRWLLGCAALLLAVGCGEVETDDASAPETRTIDLRLDGVHSIVPSTGEDNDVVVIRRNGEEVDFNDWALRLTLRHDLEVNRRATPETDPALYVVVTDPHGVVTEEDAKLVAEDERELREKGAAACPDTCVHCPEDNAYLCAALCGR